jgi:hypothetical protein
MMMTMQHQEHDENIGAQRAREIAVMVHRTALNTVVGVPKAGAMRPQPIRSA